MKITNRTELLEYMHKQMNKYPKDGIIKVVFVNKFIQKRYYIVDDGDELIFPDMFAYVYDNQYAYYEWAGNGYNCNMKNIDYFMSSGMEIEEDNPYIGKYLYYMYNSFEIIHYRQEIDLYEKKIKKLEELNHAYELQQTFE